MESNGCKDYKSFAISFTNKCFVMFAEPIYVYNVYWSYKGYGWAKPISKEKFLIGIADDFECNDSKFTVDYIAFGY